MALGSVLAGLAASSTSPDSEYMTSDPKKIGAIVGALSGTAAAGNQANTRFVNPPQTPASAQSQVSLVTPVAQGVNVPANADLGKQLAMAKQAQITGNYEAPREDAPQPQVVTKTPAQQNAVNVVNAMLADHHAGNEVDMHDHAPERDTRIQDSHDLFNAANHLEQNAYDRYGEALNANPPSRQPFRLSPAHAGLSLLMAGLLQGAGKGFSDEGNAFGHSLLGTLKEQQDEDNAAEQEDYRNQMAQGHAQYSSALQHAGNMRDAAQALRDEYFKDQADKMRRDQYDADSRSQAESDSLKRVDTALKAFHSASESKTATPQSIQAAYDALKAAESQHIAKYPSFSGAGVNDSALKSLKDQALAGLVANQSKQWSERLNKERNVSGFFDESRAGQLDTERSGIFRRLGIQDDPNDDAETKSYKEQLRNSLEVPTTERAYKMVQGEERIKNTGAKLEFLKDKQRQDLSIKAGNLELAKKRVAIAAQRERDLLALGTDRNAIAAANAQTRRAESDYDSTVDDLDKEINKLQSSIEKKNVALAGQDAKVLALAKDPLGQMQAKGVQSAMLAQRQALETLRGQKIGQRNEAATKANNKGTPDINAARQEGLILSQRNPSKAAAIKARFKQVYGQEL